MRLTLVGAVIMCTGTTLAQERADSARNGWYWDSIVNLHIDNHSGLVGKGHTVDELADMVRDIDVDMIQVSAMGNGGTTTYQTQIQRHPQLKDWDTLRVWGQVARQLGRRFGVYINTRGLQLHKQRPDWMQRDVAGEARGRNNGFDICMRPTPGGTGALEEVFLPMLAEFGTRDQPDALWVDGDHARTWTCYCGNCKAAWTQLTGQNEPPAAPASPDWTRWLTFQLDRFDNYRRQMANTVHRACPKCLYTSNHSWRFRAKDPRCVPEYVDTISGDLSHGLALRMTRLSAMQIGPEESVPCDIMHNFMYVNHGKGHAASFRRIAQQGAATMAAGGAWFLWSPGSAIVEKPVQARARQCAEFAQARKTALGRSTSLNPVAVLLSETCWKQERLHGREGYYEPEFSESVALALQDACYGVDMPNEEILCRRLSSYGVVVIAGHRMVAPETMAALNAWVQEGGLLLVIGEGLADVAGSAELLGVRHEGRTPGVRRLETGDGVVVVKDVLGLVPEQAEAVASSADGQPLLTQRPAGGGAVAYLALGGMSYPDDGGTIGWIMQRLGFGPGIDVRGEARSEHLLFSVRRKPGKAILHVTDISSRVKGRRVVPATRNDIDDGDPLPEVTLRVPLPQRPTAVTAVPATCSVEHTWEDGVLAMTLRRLHIHAAVVIDVDAGPRMDVLPPSTPRAAPRVVPQVASEDFEGIRLQDGLPEGLGRVTARGDTAIRLSLDTAASGQRSLKFVDSSDAPQPFHPYLAMRLKGLHSGVGYVSLDLCLDRAAEVVIELREVENARQFPVGPSLTFSATHGITVAGQKTPLVRIDADSWFHVDIIVPFDGSGMFRLRVARPGQPPREFASLPCRSRDFCQCGWIGIIGMGTQKAVFHVDNLRFGRAQTLEEVPDPTHIDPTASSRRVPVADEPGLAAWWRFDEGTGISAADCSGNDNHGDVGAEWTDGRVGKALRFTSARDADVIVPDSPTLRFGSDSFSIDFWSRPESLRGPKHFRRVIEKPGYPQSWWNIDFLSDGRVEMEMGDAAGNSGTTSSAGTIPLNEWTHVAVVVDRDKATAAYYFDGKHDSTKPLPGTFTGPLDVAGHDMSIGARTQPFIGSIDELRIYRRPLTQSEITTHATP